MNAFAVSATNAAALAKVNVPLLVEKLFDQEGRNSPPILKECRPFKTVSVSAPVAVRMPRPVSAGPPITRPML